jgi:predicted dinucleotide-binding enzyme
MNVTVIGAGHVGSSLGLGLSRTDHVVTFGVRNPSDPKYASLKTERTRLDTVRAAVQSAEVIILATPWNTVEAVLKDLGDLGGKTLIDATNPIGPGFTLTHGTNDSGAEQVARWAKNAKVVKAFNSTGFENMQNPVYGEDRSVMLIAGDDDKACSVAASLAKDLGFESVKLGGLSKARLIEPMAMLWISMTQSLGTRGVAFGLLRR